MSDIARRLTTGAAPLVIAHRGDWSAAPENSLAAIRAAQAFDMVEIDVRLAADGIPVVMHDPTCARTTGQAAVVADLSAAELAAIPFPDSAERVPLLADALAAGGPDLLFDLDVKEPDELPAVARFMASRPEKARCLLKLDVQQSEDIAPLLAIEAQAGITVIAKHIAETDTSVDLLGEMKARGVVAAEVWFPDLDLLKRLIGTGLALTTYTLDEVHCAGLSDSVARDAPAAVWGVLQQAGIRGIMTDAPARLTSYLDGLAEDAALAL